MLRVQASCPYPKLFELDSCQSLFDNSGKIVIFNLMRGIWINILLIGVVGLGFTSPQNPPLDPPKAIAKGLKYYQKDQFDSAYYYYEIARTEAIKIDDWSSWVIATARIGRAYTDQGEFENGKMYLDSALSLGIEKLGKKHTSTLGAQNQLGIYHQYFGEFQQSFDYHMDVLETLKTMPNAHDTFFSGAYEKLAFDYLYLEKYEKAYETALKGRDLRAKHVAEDDEFVAIFENLLGALASTLGRNDEAQERYQKALDIFLAHHDSASSRVLTMIGNIGNLALNRMDYEKAYEYFSSTVPYLDDMPVLTQYNNLYNTGLILNLIGDYEKGTIYLEEARSRLSIAPEVYQEQIANIEFEFARAFSEMADYEKALNYLQKAITIKTEIYGETYPEQSYDLNLMSIILREQGKTKEAYQQLQKANTILVSIFGQNHPDVAKNLVLMGEVLMDLGELEQAESYTRKALKIYESTLSKDHPYIYDTKIDLAVVHRVAEEFDEGIEICQETLKELLPDSVDINHIAKGQFSPYWTIRKFDKIISEYGILLMEKYKAHGEIEDLKGATILFSETVAVFDSLRETYQFSSSRNELVAEYNYVFERKLEADFLLSKTDDSQSFLEEAFLTTEKTKSRNLIETIQEREALNFANVPDSILARERLLKRELTSFLSQIEDSPSISKPTDNQYIETNNAYIKLLSNIQKDYPEYYELKFPKEPISSDDLAAMLSPNQISYNYYWGRDNLFIFRHFQGKSSFYQVKLHPELDSLLNQWLTFINAPPDDDDSFLKGKLDASYQLFQILLPEWPYHVETLYVFPDGKLGYLPFESLLVDKPSGDLDFRGLPYLVKESRVVYAYSASLWEKNHRQSMVKGNLNYYGFAPRFGDLIADSEAGTSRGVTRNTLPPLLFNEKEVNESAQLFKGEAFTGYQAKENLLIGEWDNSLIHFATHAIVNQNNPLNSKLFLSDGKTGENDGILHAYEIYNLQLNSPLVILSACETGTGTFVRGEGVMSLARAFQYAGAQTLVTSLWRADDQASYEIITSFLENLKGGDRKSEALQKAQLAWISGADGYYSHPFFWAGFVNIGELEVGKSENSNWIFFLLIGAAFLITFIYLRYRKTKNPGRVQPK